MNVYSRVEAVLLTLDPAKGKSGAAILRPDGPRIRLVTGAVVTKQVDRDMFVASAKELALALKLPLIVVAEEWDPPRFRRAKPGEKSALGIVRVDDHWGYSTVLGIGEGWGKWTAEFERHGISDLDVVRVTPNVWRDALYGKNREKASEALKLFAVRYVESRIKQTLPPDVAEAVCIGFWGFHSPEVARRAEVWARKHRALV